MSTKELREKRAQIAHRMREMSDKLRVEQRDFQPAEAEQWNAINRDYDNLTVRIQNEERMGEVNRDQRAPAYRRDLPGRDTYNGRDAAAHDAREADDDDEVRTAPTPEDAATALQSWMRVQSGMDINARQADACRRAGVNPRRNSFDIALDRRAANGRQTRAMSAIDQTVGGTFVQPTFASMFETALLDFGGMRQVADIMRTDTGAEMAWPTVNDATNEGYIIGENVQVSDSNVNTDAVRFGAHKYTSGMIRVPVELLEDSAFDLATVVGQMCGERIGRRQNRDFTVGDGAAKPTGVVTAAPVGCFTASATAITLAEIMALEHSVDPAYRNSPKTMFMFHDAVLLFLRQLADSQGRPLWQSNVALGMPDTFNGRQFIINQNMEATVAGGKITAAFGDFSKYKIRDVRGLRLRRLVERYADNDQEGFVAFFRSDGNLLDAGTHPIKTLKQHA